MRIIKLQFIRLAHFIIVCITRWLPFATLIQPEERNLSQSLVPSHFLGWQEDSELGQEMTESVTKY